MTINSIFKNYLFLLGGYQSQKTSSYLQTTFFVLLDLHWQIQFVESWVWILTWVSCGERMPGLRLSVGQVCLIILILGWNAVCIGSDNTRCPRREKMWQYFVTVLYFVNNFEALTHKYYSIKMLSKTLHREPVYISKYSLIIQHPRYPGSWLIGYDTLFVWM